MKSETIGALAAALAKAQSQISGAVKDANNPFFKSKYADLESVWQACRKPLTDNGLSVVQTTRHTTDTLMLITTLMHASGEWIAGEMPVLMKDYSPQAQGSGLTYARRYALAALVGIYQTDDDAEAAMSRREQPKKFPPLLQKIASTETVQDLNAIYKGISEEMRATHLAEFQNKRALLMEQNTTIEKELTQ